MKTIQITKDKALKAFQNADETGKALLKDLFGADEFYTNITDRVKTFEDALEVLELPERITLSATPPDLPGLESVAAYSKLIIIAHALNEGWEPDWSNRNQVKYVPYFEYNKTGFAFVFSDCAYWTTDTTVGSRLCFKSSDLAIYAGKQFTDIYNDFFLIKH